MRRHRIVTAGIMFLACFAATSHADRRSYVWTYEYATMPQGIAEVEYYLTAKVPDAGVKEASAWQHWVEIEYGLTDNWDFSMYQMWEQAYKTNSASFKYDGFKMRTRYKLFKAGEFIVDPLLYAEYIRKADLSKPDVLEGKLVLARDIGEFNAAYNQIVKVELSGDGETEHEYAAGVSRNLGSGCKAGVEAKGNYSEEKHALGPTVSIETEKFWASLGAAFGLNDDTDDLQSRLLAGFAF